jgi:hypothetical protein
MPDATIAASRAEASRDVSGSGSAELARRSAAATERDSARVAQPGTEDQLPNSDASLIERVRMALSSPATTPGVSAGAPPLSIQQLNNLSVTATGQVVTLRGTVRSEDEKREIGSRVEAVPGVKQVRNDLEVQR